MARFHYFLLLKNIPVCVTYIIVFIHSSAGECLDRIRVLAGTSNAVTRRAHTAFPAGVLFASEKHPDVELLHCRAGLFVMF